MLDRLVESKARRSRSLLGFVVSVTAHLAIIVIAVHATAQSRPRAAPVPKLAIVPFAQKALAGETRRSHPTRTRTDPVPMNRFVHIAIDPKLPPLDFLPASPTSPTDFTNVSIATGRSDDGAAAQRLNGTFNAEQVERPVSVLPGAPVPKYPESLRIAGIEGRVVAQFVVDESGVVEADSVRFVQSDNELFEAAVRTVLQRIRFAPAEIGGRRVRQLVQMPFVFSLAPR